MTTTTKPFQQLIGQTEKTLNAILEHQLAGTVSEPEWIALVLLSGHGGSVDSHELSVRLARALRVNDETAVGHVGRLTAKGLIRGTAGIDAAVTLTEDGRQFVGGVQQQVGRITQRLWGDLPAADLEAASTVLTTVLARAEAELEAAS